MSKPDCCGLRAAGVAVLGTVRWFRRDFCDVEQDSCAPDVRLTRSLPHLE